MQVQCDDITYFVTAQALGVTNQVVCYSRPIATLLGTATSADIRVDFNAAHQMLGLAWRGAPTEVTSTTSLDVNTAERVMVVWLDPLCKCAIHARDHFCDPPFAFGVTVAHNPDREGPCYMKVWAKGIKY